MLKGIRKKLISIITASTMVISLMPAFKMTVHAESVAGTLVFSSPLPNTDESGIMMGGIINDGSSAINVTSNDIPNILIDIFGSLSEDNAKNNIPNGNIWYYKNSDENGIYNEDPNTKVIVIKSHNGTDFSLKSIQLNNDASDHNSNLIFEAYNNGILNGSTNINLLPNANTTFGVAQDCFQNVDEVRITNTNGDLFSTLINNIQIGDPTPAVSGVSIDGTTQVGQTLTGNYTFTGGTDNSTYQWYRAKSSTGAGATPISGATSKTYKLTTSDTDQDSDSDEIYIGLTVTPNNGYVSGTSATTTTYVGPITNSSTQHDYVVTNTNDSGAGSLRWAIVQAGLYGNGNITFDSSLKGSTITLSSNLTTWDTSNDVFGQSRYSGAQLNDFSGNFTLTGLTDESGKPAITINGSGHIGIWATGSGIFNISNLKFTNFALNSSDGTYDGFGSAIATGGAYTHVNLNNLIFDSNTANARQNSGIASLSANEDPYEVNVDRCIFSNNTMSESVSDASYTPSAGALYVNTAKKLKLTNSLFVSNTASANIASTVYGGGAFANTGGADVLNCTFYNNKLTNSNSGGFVKGAAIGVYEDDTVPFNLYNNIMIGNTANGSDSTYYTNNGTDGHAAFNKSNNLLTGTASNIFKDALNGDFTLKGTATDAIDKGDNAHTFGSYDLANNSRIINSTVDLGAYESEIPGPTVSVSGNPATWTNSDVVLTINASDSGSGLDTTGAYSFDDGSSWTTSNSKSFSANGTVKIKVRNNAGISSSQSVVIDKIDKAAPTITSIAPSPADWTSGSVTLTVAAGDALSGIAAYSFDGGNNWQTQNTKTYSANESNIQVQVKDAAGNIAVYGSTINITNIDSTAPNTAVIADSDKYTVNDWYNSTQIISASFTKTSGCAEKLQYSVNGGAWTDGESVNVSDEGTHDVSFRVIDDLNRVGTAQTVKVNIDNAAPTSAKITIKDKEFTSILNTITFGIFFKDKVNVSITANDSLSGVKTIEYQKVSKDTDYNPSGTWVSGSSFDVNPDDKFIVYARVTDKAGNYVVVNSDGIIVDSTNPDLALTKDAADWANSDVNVQVEAADALAGVKEVTYSTNEVTPKTGTVALSSGKGNITLSNEGNYVLSVTAKDNSDNETIQSSNIKIDKTVPTITSVTGNSGSLTSSNVTLTVNASDALSGIAAYSFDGGSTWQTQNTKTYSANESNIQVKVKDAAGNIAAYGSLINITTIDSTAPNTAVIADSDKYTVNDWYNSDQLISASFTKTSGCAEKLQYSVNGGAWTDGESVNVSDEGTHDVSFRVIDELNRTSTVQTVKVNIDKTAPTGAKITIKDKEFTSILNTITFGIFFKDTVNVSITADANVSGIKTIEYQKVSKDTDYNPSGTWVSGSSFDVNPDDKFIVYARVTDKAGNYVVVNSDGIIVDSTNPDLALTKDAADWTKNDVNVKIEASDKLAGLKEVTYTTNEAAPQSGTVAISGGVGNIKLSNEGQYTLTVTAKDNADNIVSQSVDIKIDRTVPKLTGASDASSYLIGRVIKLSDDMGEIASATYQKDAAADTYFSDGVLFDKPGKYTLNLIDKAGNSAKLSFEIKALPKVEDIIYAVDNKTLIDSIRAEFDSHKDLPEPYKTDTDNEIKALESRYTELQKEVVDAKTETSVIKGKVGLLSNGVDGLISIKKEIQDEYNNINTLTKEQKLSLDMEAQYLKQQLDLVAQLESQIDDIKTRTSSIDTTVDGLISKEGSIKAILADAGKLTAEQKNILKPQIDTLNGLADKISVLKQQVDTVKGLISKLPSAEKVTKENASQLVNVEKAYNELTSEQKGLVGDYYVQWLKDSIDALNKLMLHDDESDLTVTGIDGTSFDLDVYLVVEPIKADSAGAGVASKFAISADSVKKAAETNADIKGKELLALYDVSLFKGNVKVQPDGKVKVKIKVPEELKGRTGLDIVHIADDGTVTSMHAVIEDGYLVFITTHFSDYAIVAQPVEKATANATALPQTGSVFDMESILALGIFLILTGVVVIRRPRKKKASSES